MWTSTCNRLEISPGWTRADPPLTADPTQDTAKKKKKNTTNIWIWETDWGVNREFKYEEPFCWANLFAIQWYCFFYFFIKFSIAITASIIIHLIYQVNLLQPEIDFKIIITSLYFSVIITFCMNTNAIRFSHARLKNVDCIQMNGCVLTERSSFPESFMCWWIIPPPLRFEHPVSPHCGSKVKVRWFNTGGGRSQFEPEGSVQKF